MQTKTAFAKRCFVKSQSDLPIAMKTNRAQSVFETLFFCFFLFFLFFFFSFVHRTRTAKALTRHSFFLPHFVLDISIFHTIDWHRLIVSDM